MSKREQESIAAAANYPHLFVYVQELPHVLNVLQDKIRESPWQYQHLWETILQQGIAWGELRAEFDVPSTVFMILGMCNWMHRWYRQGGRLDIEALAQQYASAILDGIVVRPPPAESPQGPSSC